MSETKKEEAWLPQEKFKSQINEPIYRPPQEKGNQKYTALDGYLKGVSSGGGSDGMSGPGGDSMEK